MKKNEKRGIIISIITTIMGLVGIVYTTIIKNSIDNSVSMYNLSITYLILGLALILYFIRLSKNKKKSDEQENFYMDERINSNIRKSCYLTFKIIIDASFITDFMVTIFLRQYRELADTLNVFIGISIFIYFVVYYFVSKNN